MHIYKIIWNKLYRHIIHNNNNNMLCFTCTKYIHTYVRYVHNTYYKYKYAGTFKYTYKIRLCFVTLRPTSTIICNTNSICISLCIYAKLFIYHKFKSININLNILHCLLFKFSLWCWFYLYNNINWNKVHIFIKSKNSHQTHTYIKQQLIIMMFI